VTLAVDAAESVGPEDAVQKMLVHEMATAHKVVMELLASANRELQAHERDRLMEGAGGALTDATRCATAAARVMDSITRSALAFDRLKKGGRQLVTVQYVMVADGAQAVVAGNVHSGDAARLRRDRRGGGASS
jgi:hypothetical protein